MVGKVWGEGITAKRISAALRPWSTKTSVVNLNSPRAICLKSASIIAMAGDEIKNGAWCFLMIHNCWAVRVGNQHDFAKLAHDLAPLMPR